MANAGYSLLPPDPRMYDITQEQAGFRGMFGRPGVNPGTFLGSMYAADVDAENARIGYERQLARTNERQYDLGLRRIAADEQESADRVVTQGMQNPGGAAYFTRSRDMIEPGMLPQAVRQSAADVNLTEAKGLNERLTAYRQGSEAGIAAPTGAPFDPATGATAATLTQGQRPDIAIANIRAASEANTASAGANGERLRDVIALAEHNRRIEESVVAHGERAYNNAVRAALTEQMDVNTNTIRPAPISPAEAERIGHAARMRAEEAARRTTAGTNQLLEATGRARLSLPTRPAPAGQQAPQAPPNVNAAGGEGTPTVTSTAPPLQVNAAGATRTGPGSARTSANAGNTTDPRAMQLQTALTRDGVAEPGETTQRLIQRMRQLGGRGIQPNTNGTVHILDAQGKVIATERVR